jgi:hypothetical protein
MRVLTCCHLCNSYFQTQRYLNSLSPEVNDRLVSRNIVVAAATTTTTIITTATTTTTSVKSGFTDVH